MSRPACYMKTIFGCLALSMTICHATFSQVDTTFVYNTSTPYGTLDIRLAKSASRYYYLQENKTFSFRESSPGVRTGTYRDMTSWDSSPYGQGNLREKNGSSDYFVMNYRLLKPLAKTFRRLLYRLTPIFQKWRGMRWKAAPAW